MSAAGCNARALIENSESLLNVKLRLQQQPLLACSDGIETFYSSPQHCARFSRRPKLLEPPRVLGGERLCGLTFFQFAAAMAGNLISQRARIIVCVLTGRLVSCTSGDTSSSFSSYSGSGLLAQENSTFPEVCGVVLEDCGRRWETPCRRQQVRDFYNSQVSGKGTTFTSPSLDATCSFR
jgi:hypothetical protein